jgi:hypothetical protein
MQNGDRDAKALSCFRLICGSKKGVSEFQQKQLLNTYYNAFVSSFFQTQDYFSFVSAFIFLDVG